VGYPNKKILKRCWNNNPDGAGYAYLTEDDDWYVKKGMQTWSKFWKSWKKQNFKKEHTVFLHFRVGTSGKIDDGFCSPDCTHPFPLSAKEDDLMKHEYRANNIVIHNGVVGKGEYPLSDTQVAVRDHISVLQPYMEKDPAVKKLLTQLLDTRPKSGSRWLITNGSNYELFGQWLLDKDSKIWYSNKYYKEDKVKKTNVKKEINKATGVTTSYNTSKATIYDGLVNPAVDYMSASEWDWKKWDRDTTSYGTVSIPDATVTTNEYEEYGIYNHDNELIGVVDNQGNTLWDDDIQDNNDKDDEAVLYHCPDCAASFYEHQLSNEECPYCLCALTKDDLRCPFCRESDWLIDTGHSIGSPKGDTECMKCGAIFNEDIEGMESVVAWNESSKKIYIKHTENEMTRAAK